MSNIGDFEVGTQLDSGCIKSCDISAKRNLNMYSVIQIIVFITMRLKQVLINTYTY